MADLTTTRTATYGHLFIPGLPPLDLSDRQIDELAELHWSAVQRGEATRTEGPRTAGGWNLTAPLQHFGRLEAITQGILTGNSVPFRAYRA